MTLVLPCGLETCGRLTSRGAADVLAPMLGIAGSIGAGFMWGWLGGGVTAGAPALAAWSAALAAEAALVVDVAAAPVVLAACAAGWSARAVWQRRLVRGAA
jgi:hypothetical protein